MGASEGGRERESVCVRVCMPEYVVWCVCFEKERKMKKMEKLKIGTHWPEKSQ